MTHDHRIPYGHRFRYEPPPRIFKCNDPAYIWYRVPRVSSTSIKRSLIKTTEPVYISRPILDENGEAHSNLQEINSIENIEQYFKFIFVRNPYDKVLSAWRLLFQNYKRWEQMSPNKDFDTFVKNIQHFKNHHWDLQTKFLAGPVDFIGKYENLSQDWEVVKKNIDVQDLDHWNNGKDKTPETNSKTATPDDPPWLKYYNDELVQIVNSIYKEDFEKFEYEML